MVDLKKRRTIKLLTGASAVALSSTAFSTAVAADSVGLSGPSTNANNPLFADQLKIQIITGNHSPEDTVILVNNSQQNIMVKEFLPRYVSFENHMMDLNELCKQQPLVIKPGYPVASKLAQWEVLALTKSSSYLWADNAAMTLSTPHSGVLTINAAVVNGQALLTIQNPNSVEAYS